MTRTPELKSFLVADHVIQEKGTEKWSVIGVFDRIWSKQYPMTYAALGVFAKVADVQGQHAVKIEFRDSDDRCLAECKGLTVTVEGAPQTVAFGVQMFHLPIPRPDKYHFMLYFSDQLVAIIPIEAMRVPEQKR
jgi:hypothetical protein